MPSHHPSEEAIQPDSPLTWADIPDVFDLLGIRPVKHKAKRRSSAASRIHEAYDLWLERGRLTGIGYVMSLGDLYHELSCWRSDGTFIECHRERCDAARTARRIIPLALNDDRSGLVLIERPLHKYRRRAA